MSGVLGPLLIAFAATLWATDALLRAPLVHELSSVYIVLFEHLLGSLILLAWTLVNHRRRLSGHLAGYPLKSWFSLVLIGVGGSAFATVLFTESFRYVNPSVAILLQKLQPLMVISLAFFFLGERPSRGFWIWAFVALCGAIGVSAPGFDFRGEVDFHSRGVLYAISAAALWASCTIAGKSVSQTLPPSVMTFWRYAFGLAGLLALAAFSRRAVFPTAALGILHEGRVLRALLYITFFPGIAGLLFYYEGLKRSSAIAATFTELIFPVSAVTLNWIFLGASLSLVQILSGFVLLFSVSQIALRTRSSR